MSEDRLDQLVAALGRTRPRLDDLTRARVAASLAESIRAEAAGSSSPAIARLRPRRRRWIGGVAATAIIVAAGVAFAWRGGVLLGLAAGHHDRPAPSAAPPHATPHSAALPAAAAQPVPAALPASATHPAAAAVPVPAAVPAAAAQPAATEVAELRPPAQPPSAPAPRAAVATAAAPPPAPARSQAVARVSARPPPIAADAAARPPSLAVQPHPPPPAVEPVAAAPPAPPAGSDIAARYAAAERKLVSDPPAARAELNALVAELPQAAEAAPALLDLAWLAVKAGDPAAARDALDRLATHPAGAALAMSAAYVRCIIEHDTAALRTCLTEFRAKFPASPRDPDVLARLAVSLASAGDCRAAWPLLTEYSRRYPQGSSAAALKLWRDRCAP